jgi:hypothetical protein
VRRELIAAAAERQRPQPLNFIGPHRFNQFVYALGDVPKRRYSEFYDVYANAGNGRAAVI